MTRLHMGTLGISSQAPGGWPGITLPAGRPFYAVPSQAISKTSVKANTEKFNSVMDTKLARRAAAMTAKIAGNTATDLRPLARCQRDLKAVLDCCPHHMGKLDKDREAARLIGWRPVNWGARRIRMIRDGSAGASIILDFLSAFERWQARQCAGGETASHVVSERENLMALAARMDRLEALLEKATDVLRRTGARPAAAPLAAGDIQKTAAAHRMVRTA